MKKKLMASRNVLLFFIMTGNCIKTTESMGLCEFEEKFPCVYENDCPKYTCIGDRRGSPTKNNKYGTNTPQPVSNRTATTDLPTDHKFFTNRSTAVQLDGYSTADSLPTNPVCPPNMVYTNCSCQGTCEDPRSCYNNCTEPKICVCPDGFLMGGNDCIPEKMCGCFIQGYGVLLKDGFYVNSTCSERCTCYEEILSCEENFKCDSNAICEQRGSVRDCYCNTGFAGDGQTCNNTSTFSDCYEIFTAGFTNDGVYTVVPNGWTGPPFEVYCNMSHGGGWTVIQRRVDGSVDFKRNWTTYKEGFGVKNHEFWLGNEILFYLTNHRNYQLRIDMTNQVPVYMAYDLFRVSNEGNDYQLTLGNYTGNAGYDYMINHRDRAFSTFDLENGSCAESHKGGWWYKNCFTANLNGIYRNPTEFSVAVCDSSHGNYQYFQYTQMKIRPV